MTPSKEMLDQIVHEEGELILERFTEEDAWELGCLLVEEARKREARVAVDIRRPRRFCSTRPSRVPLRITMSGYAANQMWYSVSERHRSPLG